MTEVEGRRMSPDQTLKPMCCSPLMGFSWSLYFAHSANRARVNRQPSLCRSVEMTDRGLPFLMGNQSQDAQTGHSLYVDNIGIVSDQAARAHSALQRVRKISREAGSRYPRFRCFLVPDAPLVSTSTSISCEPFPWWNVLVDTALDSDAS